MHDSRLTSLREWMSSHDITFKAVGEHLDVTGNGARTLLHRNTIPTKRHEQLRSLGFPHDLLPEPCDKKTGPRPKTPFFPGLMAVQAEA